MKNKLVKILMTSIILPSFFMTTIIEPIPIVNAEEVELYEDNDTSLEEEKSEDASEENEDIITETGASDVQEEIAQDESGNDSETNVEEEDTVQSTESVEIENAAMLGAEADEIIVESEPNDSFARADPIEADVIYYGSIAGVGDWDYYCFTINRAGNFEFALAHNANNIPWEQPYWRMSIFDAGHTEIAKRYGYRTQDTMTMPCTLKKGTYYFVVTSGYNSRDYAFTLYDLDNEPDGNTSASDGAQDSYFEQEPNDSLDTANPIDTNAYYYGEAKQLDTSPDCYRFDIKKNGTFTISLNHPCGALSNSGRTWYMRLYDERQNRIATKSVGTTWNDEEDPLVKWQQSLSEGIYYLKIECERNNSIYNFIISGDNKINTGDLSGSNIDNTSNSNTSNEDSEVNINDPDTESGSDQNNTNNSVSGNNSSSSASSPSGSTTQAVSSSSSSASSTSSASSSSGGSSKKSKSKKSTKKKSTKKKSTKKKTTKKKSTKKKSTKKSSKKK